MAVKLTLALWAAMSTGYRAADAPGPILLSLVLSFAAQNAVTGLRMAALAPAG